MKWIIKDCDGWIFEISEIDDVKTLRVGDKNGWVDNTYPFDTANMVNGMLTFYDEFGVKVFDIVTDELDMDSLIIRE